MSSRRSSRPSPPRASPPRPVDAAGADDLPAAALESRSPSPRRQPRWTSSRMGGSSSGSGWVPRGGGQRVRARPRERVPRLRAHLDVIKKLWTGVPVDYESAYCRLKGATMALPAGPAAPPAGLGGGEQRSGGGAGGRDRRYLGHQPARDAGDDRAADGAVLRGARSVRQAVPRMSCR